MTEKSSREARPLIGFITRDNAPQISPAPISRTWMSEMAELRIGWPNRCLPMLIANQSGWELRNPCGFTATWMGQQGVDVMIAPDKRDAGQLLPASHFGDGILTWHLPILFVPRRATTSWSAGWRTIRRTPWLRWKVSSKPTGRARVSA